MTVPIRQPPSDSDPFPFGEFKDELYEDVPAARLLWYADQSWLNKWPDVQAYVEHNRMVLEAEVEDDNSD